MIAIYKSVANDEGSSANLFRSLILYLKDIWYFRQSLIAVFLPLVLLLLPISGSEEAKCGYVVIIVAVFWVMEVLPLAVTALIPLFLFPLMGTLTAKQVCQNYMKDVHVLFIGGLFIAIAIQESQLHKRIALKALMLFGTSPKWLLLGVMLTTAFLSMWITNTATTAMMLPIVEAVLVELVQNERHLKEENTRKKSENYEMQNNTETNPKLNDAVENPSFSESKQEIDASSPRTFLTKENLSKEELNLCKCMVIAIAYSANIGGTGSLTGTPPNIVMAGFLEEYYGSKTELSFATWMGFSIPGMLLFLFITWLWLQIIFLGWRSLVCKSKVESSSSSNVKDIIKNKYEELGSIRWNETLVTIAFLFLVVLWILREPKFIIGWSALFKDKYVSDGTSAMLVCYFLFLLPAQKPDWLCTTSREKNKPPQIRDSLLTWDKLEKQFPWGVCILLGGGFALGEALNVSGLSKRFGDLLSNLAGLGKEGVCAVSIIIMIFGTELMSNTASTNVFVPILFSVADSLKVNPLYFSLAVTVSASFAFMLPVATPPNAVVFGSGVLRIRDMVVTGFVLNIMGVFLMLLSINTWTHAMFNLGTYPDWAIAAQNSTSFTGNL